VESFNIAQEQSNDLVTGGIWSICVWLDEEEGWFSYVQFSPQGQSCIVAFAPFGPFSTAEIALREGEAEFHQHHYHDYMTLLPRLALIWPETYRDNPDLTLDIEREIQEVYSFPENSTEAYGLDGRALPT
jgi:hypothetical protein